MHLGVICTAAPGIPLGYLEQANHWGTILAEEGHTVTVVGDGDMLRHFSVGYHAAEGTHITGILTIGNKTPPRLDQVYTGQDVARALEQLAIKVDGIVALPGGYDTLALAARLINDKSQKKHTCPIVLYNFKTFWQDLDKLYHKAHRSGLNPVNPKELYCLSPNISGALNYLYALSPAKTNRQFA